MKVWLIRLLKQFVRWLEGDIADVLLARARELVGEQELRWPDRDGEAKRHQVYARLIKDFPRVSKRVLSRAIERSLD